MNKIAKYLFGFSIIILLTGCLQIPLGYTPNVDIPQNYEGNKYDITFSVEYLSDGDVSIGRATKEQYVSWIKNYLEESNAFNSVTYKDINNKSNYHIHFIVHYSALPVGESAGIGFIMGYTLFTIPMWINMNLDSSAILYLHGKPLFTPTTTETLKCYVWLPFLPVGLVWNQWWAWSTQETKCCRYLINEIVTYQKNNL